MIEARTPSSLEEALEALARQPELLPIAGCTDLMVVPLEGRPVLDLLGIPEIRGIRETQEGWEIGATTTFTEIARSQALAQALPALARAASQVGGWQIQNRATLGGNVVNASPAGDSLPVLLALDARVVIAGCAGRRVMPYAEFVRGYRRTALEPGELVAWIQIPAPAPGTYQAFRKVGTRAAQTISKVSAALVARVTPEGLAGVRIAAGSVAPTPLRLTQAEAACEGRLPVEETAAAAAEAAAREVAPINDVRSTAAYRRFALAGIVRRMVRATAGAPGGPGEGDRPQGCPRT